MSVCTNLFLLIGTLALIVLNNPTLRILTSPSSSHPSPRFLTHNPTPHKRKRIANATQCTP